MKIKRAVVLTTGLCALALVGGAGTAYAAMATEGNAVASTPAGSQMWTSTGMAINIWEVPSGVTSLTFEAAGGNGGRSPGAGPNVTPGSGADIQGTFAVKPGQVVTIAVGESGGTGDGGWGPEGMSGGPANTAKDNDRDGGAGGGATMIGLANADGSNWHEIAVAGGGGGQGGGSSDPVSAGDGGIAGCTTFQLTRGQGSYECLTPSWTGADGGHGTTGLLGGAGGVTGGSTSGAGQRGLGASGLGG